VSLRERYRDLHGWAMLKLARLCRQAGRCEEAVALYKARLKADPTLEDVVRELYRCYAAMGDLTSLIREDRHLRQALREAYPSPNNPDDDPDQYQPERATVELFHQLRGELERRDAGTVVAGAARAQ
jgi:DNA-binding SARP family transcriptional activator